ncbi:MAG: hypothetical protein ACSLE4_13765 [Methyloceanibacter sp.]|uniref:hypothetical protein n=1 Tax=Methyloceanibacter sp. TaxID=1965321 RepID=UPI003EDFB65B
MTTDAELKALWEEWKRVLMTWGEQTDEKVAKRLFHEGEAIAKKIAATPAEGLDGLAIQFGLYYYVRHPSLDPYTAPLADAIKDGMVRLTGIDAAGEALAIAESPADKTKLQ